jgi:hypothetical protein
MVFHGANTSAALSARSLPEKARWHIILPAVNGIKADV